MYKCGQKAKKQLEKFAKNHVLTCKKTEKDSYGRLVAVCFNSTNYDVGMLMVRTGYAISTNYKKNYYKDAENQAKWAKLGIWDGKFKDPYHWRSKYSKTESFEY